MEGQLRFGKAFGLLLTLCFAATGCRSTPFGQALFGSAEVSSSNRFALVPRSTSVSPMAQAPSEQIVWRAAAPSNEGQMVSTASAPPQKLPPLLDADKKEITPVSWPTQDPKVEFAGGANQNAKDAAPKAEDLPAPRPLPGPEVHSDASIPVGDLHGPLHGPAPHELNMMSLPPYTVEPPDILLVESTRGLPDQPVRGQHLVRPDGTINLGIYGSIYVTGMTLEQLKAPIAQAIASRLDPKVVAKNPVKPEDVSVDVLAYNSKVYYVITDGGGYGEQVYRLPITGNERVLDAIAQTPVNGLPPVASKRHIWVARRVPGHGAHDVILPVDWCGITQRGEAATNYQVFPGDRVYVKAQHLILIDSTIAKIVSPIERLLGVTLLGSETVNSIRNRSTSTSP